MRAAEILSRRLDPAAKKREMRYNNQRARRKNTNMPSLKITLNMSKQSLL